MQKSWLDIMADDSNLSMASITSITSKDAEFDNSKQGVNLLFNKNVQIICDDSQSRKRTFKEMESQQTKYQQIESNKENHKFLPPKAKQRTNVNGDWKKRKNENNKIGFGRFLNWANNDNSNNDKILTNKINDNKKNIYHIINNKENNDKNIGSNSKLIICGSSMNQNRGRRRKQIRARKNNKKDILLNINNNDKNDENDKNISNDKNVENVEKINMTKIIEEEQEELNENQNENDIDIDIDIVDVETVDLQKIDKSTKSLNDQNIIKIEEEKISHQDNDKEKEIKQEEKEEEEEDDDDDDDDDDGHDNNNNNNNNDDEEDDDIKINNMNKTKQRRITPILENVVFDANLILNKVPILKQKPLNDVLNGPIFLNADQFEKLHKKSPNLKCTKNNDKKENKIDDKEEEEEEEEEEDYDCDVWGRNSLINDNKMKNNKSQNWANKLFGKEIFENKKLKQRQEEILINQRKEERKHEIKIESLLPTSSSSISTATKCVMFSRESSVSINTDNSSSITTTTTTTTTTCKPSLEATEWREKQISIGKDTIGYKNFIKQYPNKDIKYRISNKFLSTPDSKDKIGKKRWVGKYQKWRKFLHSFDCDDVEDKTNDDIDI